MLVIHGEELPASKEFTEIDEWRSVTLSQVIWIAVPLAILTAVPYLYFAFHGAPRLVTLSYVPAAVAVTLAALLHRSFRIRALCILAVPYWLGLASMFMRGTMSLFYLLAFVIAVVILMGPRFAYGAVALSALTLLIGGQYTNWHPTLAGIDSSTLATWTVIAFNFSCVAMIMVVCCQNLLNKLERSLRAQKLAAHSVNLRQEEITRLKHELQQMQRAQAS